MAARAVRRAGAVGGLTGRPRPAYCDIRPGWVQTIHSAQGATADRVMAHLESFRANTVDAASAYVAVSRAKGHAAVYTDSRAALTHALGVRDGARIGAIDEDIGWAQEVEGIDATLWML